MQDRNALRRQMRARRRALGDGERGAAARRLATHLCKSKTFLASRRIACYWQVDGEMDCHPLIERIWAMRKDCYLPVLDTLNDNSLWFVPYEPSDKLVLNRFGIPEPDRPMREHVRAGAVDLVLAPLVAFDGHGNRLGMGGGFYDRTLAFLLRRRLWLRPLVVGVAYEFQQVARLERQPWDVPLHGIATDREYLPCR